MAGYVKIWTTLRNNTEFLSLSMTQRGMYMQLILACKEQRDDGTVCYRNVTALGSDCGCERKTAGKVLGILTDKSLCTYEQNSDGVITITIPNYKHWQELSVEGVREKTRKNTKKIPSLRPDQTRPDQSILPPEKSGDHIPFDEILKDLNRKAERNFRWRSKKGQLAAFCDEIKARWAEGYDLKDFLYVHTVMVAEWGEDEKMQGCLQPGTLYRKSKFPNYLGRPITDKAIRIQDRITAEDQIVDKTFKWRQLNVEEPKLVKAVRIKEQVWYQVEGGELRSVNHSTFLATHEKVENGREAEQAVS